LDDLTTRLNRLADAVPDVRPEGLSYNLEAALSAAEVVAGIE